MGRIQDLPAVTESTPDDQIPIDSGGFTRRIPASAFFDYVGSAAASAADASATAAAGSATAAAGSATAAGTSATNAGTSATAAGTSQTNAATSATNAATSATSAAGRASGAATSESNAGNSAATATTQAGIATTQAGIATTKAGEAATSATDAAASAASAGSKVSGPASATDGDLVLFDGTTGKLVKSGGSPSAKADVASPTFTGTPAAPTAAAGTNTTQLATTAFVLANAGSGFEKYPEDYGDILTDDHDVLIQAALNANSTIHLNPAQSYLLKAKVVMNGGNKIYGHGAAITKGFAGDMIEIVSGCELHDVKLHGDGANFTGRGIIVTAADDQRIINCDCTDTASYCIEWTVVDVGYRMVIDGGMWQVRGATLEAMKCFGASPWTPGTSADSLTNGGRYIANTFCGGGPLIDLAGAHLVDIFNISTTGITFQAGTSSCKVINGRLAGNATLKGNGNLIGRGVIVAGNVVIDSAATNCTFEYVPGMLGGTFTNNSAGSAGCVVFGYAETFTPVITGSTTAPTQGNGNWTGRIVREGRMCHVSISIGIGSTTNVGNGNWTIFLPSALQSVLTSKVVSFGSAYVFDSGTGSIAGTCQTSIGTLAITCHHGTPTTEDGGTWGSSSPITWASGDRMELSLTFEVG